MASQTEERLPTGPFPQEGREYGSENDASDILNTSLLEGMY
jgi:hypothetical protein